MLSLAALHRPASRPVAMTEKPRHASRRAVSRPMPEVAPVMTIVFMLYRLSHMPDSNQPQACQKPRLPDSIMERAMPSTIKAANTNSERSAVRRRTRFVLGEKRGTTGRGGRNGPVEAAFLKQRAHARTS